MRTRHGRNLQGNLNIKHIGKWRDFERWGALIIPTTPMLYISSRRLLLRYIMTSSADGVIIKRLVSWTHMRTWSASSRRARKR